MKQIGSIEKLENVMRNLTILLSDKLQDVGCVATLSGPIRHLWRLVTGLPTLALYCRSFNNFVAFVQTFSKHSPPELLV
jgi:hypothetical protein